MDTLTCNQVQKSRSSLASLFLLLLFFFFQKKILHKAFLHFFYQNFLRKPLTQRREVAPILYSAVSLRMEPNRFSEG